MKQKLSYILLSLLILISLLIPVFPAGVSAAPGYTQFSTGVHPTGDITPNPAAVTGNATGLGWAHRIQITIDHARISENLTHFPVMVYLSANSSARRTDVTEVFDVVGEHSRKIAITEADGVSQLYVEIEKWDAVNQQAWLWVSRSGWTISRTQDTILYLYYDNTQPDNTDFVGDTDSLIAEQVWDANFMAVYHMAGNANITGFFDSTQNNNDGTKKGVDEPRQVPGVVGSAQEFDGLDDYIDTGSGCAALTGNLTIEAFFYRTLPITSNQTALVSTRYKRSDSTLNYELGQATSGTPNMRFGNGTSGTSIESLPIRHPGLNEWAYVWGSISGNIVACGFNINDPGLVTFNGTRQMGTKVTLGVANPELSYRFFGGLEDEVRISDVARSQAWLRATYYTLKDQMLTFVLNPITQYDLTISQIGRGTTSPAAGTHHYPEGAVVTIAATADPGWRFSGWLGDLTGTHNPTSITMNSAKTVTANFTQNPPPIQPPGGGFDPGLGGGNTGGGSIDRTYVTQYMNGEPGVFTQEGFAKAYDGILRLTFPVGTRGKTVEGWALSYITLKPVPQTEQKLPNPEGGNIIGLTYALGPEGTNFAPSVILSMLYKQDQIPLSISEKDLVVGYWDEVNKKWVALDDCQVDIEKNQIVAPLSHFSTYAVLGYPPKPAPASFTVTDLTINPPEVKPGQVVTIIVTVSNTGGSPGEYDLNLKINEAVVQSKDITLGAGLSQTITFNITNTLTGLYVVDINGCTGRFSILEPEVTPIETTPALEPVVLPITPTIAPEPKAFTTVLPSPQATVSPVSQPGSKNNYTLIWIIIGIVIVIGGGLAVVVTRRKSN